MATYAIGDIQGCHATLMRLLARIRWTPGDRLWLAGDLVNRGPRSLEVLRWARGLGDRVVCVLGNHDLHLLARAEGVTDRKRRDTLDEVLEAPDRSSLLGWLREQPLFHRDQGYAIVHAGILPAWSLDDAEALALEAERALRGAPADALLAAKSRAAPRWDDELAGAERIGTILAALTRLRTVTADGSMVLEYDGPPDEAPMGCTPWFDAPRRRSDGATVLFGHWSSLGFARGPGWIGLDSGCVWGRDLTAVRLDDGQAFHEPLLDPV